MDFRLNHPAPDVDTDYQVRRARHTVRTILSFFCEILSVMRRGASDDVANDSSCLFCFIFSSAVASEPASCNRFARAFELSAVRIFSRSVHELSVAVELLRHDGNANAEEVLLI